MRRASTAVGALLAHLAQSRAAVEAAAADPAAPAAAAAFAKEEAALSAAAAGMLSGYAERLRAGSSW